MATQPTISRSPGQQAWYRLRRNKPAVFGMVIITLAILMAIFAYPLAPDATPNADDQIPELALQNPGFQIQLLRIRKDQKLPERSWWTKLWQGTPSPWKLVPVNQVKVEGNLVEAEVFRGVDPDGQLIPGLPRRWSVAEVALALDNTQDPPRMEGNQLFYRSIEGQAAQASLTELQQQIQQQQIIARTFWLGTDRYGRCMLSRLILGVRISLLVGLIAVGISLTIGILLGALAGYFGGRVDDLIMLLINTVWSIPTLLLVFAIVLALGRGVENIFLAVGLTMWVEVARIVRGQVMALKDTQYVEAAQSMGFSHWRIIRRHILPNILGPVMVVAAANFATAILVEAGLSYLGFGIQPPTPSWGNMLNENYGLAIGGQPFLALIPALAIMLMVLAFNLLGNGLRDALDVR